MSKEPEEVLPQHGVSAGLGVEEMRPQKAVEEQHHLGGRQRPHRHQDQPRNHQHHPDEERHARKRHPSATQSERRGDHIDGRRDAPKTGDQDAENPVIRGVSAREGLPRERRVGEPAHIGCSARAIEPVGAQVTEIEEQCAEEKHPESPGIEPGKGHVSGANHQRKQIICDPDDHRHAHEEDHGRAMYREEAVEDLGREQIVPRVEELQPHHGGLRAAHQEKEQPRSDVEHAQPLVVHGGHPSVQAIRPRDRGHHGDALVCGQVGAAHRVRPPLLERGQVSGDETHLGIPQAHVRHANTGLEVIRVADPGPEIGGVIE